jgi:protein-S-isoprenylcysteine O-methyltransferase Ste14
VGSLAVILMGKGLLDLGKSLTPLPYPRDDGQLVQSGVYGWVRHPIYGGLILGILGWAIAHASLSHLAAALLFWVFFDAKSAREETWLLEKYPDYADYRQRVKKLLPWIY